MCCRSVNILYYIRRGRSQSKNIYKFRLFFFSSFFSIYFFFHTNLLGTKATRAWNMILPSLHKWSRWTNWSFKFLLVEAQIIIIYAAHDPIIWFDSMSTVNWIIFHTIIERDAFNRSIENCAKVWTKKIIKFKNKRNKSLMTSYIRYIHIEIGCYPTCENKNRMLAQTAPRIYKHLPPYTHHTPKKQNKNRKN